VPDNDILSREFDSAWDASEDDPVEAERLTILYDLMIRLREYIKARGWTQKEAAARLSVTQPRISNLMRLKGDVFSLDSVVAMIARADLRVDITVREKVPPRTARRNDSAKA
jgi:predicted XRE-type DNA-binding protein